MPPRSVLRSPYAVPAVFFAVAIVSTTALGWLVSEQFRQDAIVEAQRRRALTAQAAERSAAAMHQALLDVDRLVRPVNGASVPATDSLTLVSMTDERVVVQGGGALPFLPVRGRGAREPLPPAVAAAERIEFADGGRDQPGALRAYRELALSPEARIRAAALTRAARVHRRLGHLDAALQDYAELEGEGNVTVDGLPAALIARVGRMDVHERAGNRPALHAEAESLRHVLVSGTWPLVQPEYEFYLGEVARHLGAPPAEDLDAVARAEGVNWLWQQRGTLPAGRRVLPVPHGFALVLWTNDAGTVRAAAAGPAYLAALVAQTLPPEFIATLTSVDGRILAGPAVADGAVDVRAATAGLPWSLHVWPRSGGPVSGGGRRLLLLLVFGTVALVTVTGGFFIVRGIRRERRTAAMQSDFVAAVSHEFRSPLSSMYQIAQMLASDRFRSDDARRTAYEVLVRETERLRQLVEGLLDFGRFERVAAFRFEQLDVAALVRATVNEFQERVARDGYAVELSCPAGTFFVNADREALVRALWNLLDNAVKYSPDCRTVWVELAVDADRVRIAVRDAGIGIPAHEQAQVFERFVRGAAPKSRRIKGTGIGLAMVRHIVESHGGRIRLTSDPGRGSCFTMELQTMGGRA